MRSTFLFLAVLALAIITSTAYAGVISEDVAYWCTADNGNITIFSPSTEDLNALIQAGRVLIKVQQTVYDQDWTHALLVRNGVTANIQGYLYAYSVTNINLGNPMDFSDMGIVDFAANWSTPATYVTTSQQTPAGWMAFSTTTPQWHWTSTSVPGILPGETVGGLWAVSNIGVDGVVNAQAVRVVGEGRVTVDGKTTGPVPDPASITVLLSGLGGLGIISRLRRR